MTWTGSDGHPPRGSEVPARAGRPVSAGWPEHDLESAVMASLVAA